MDDPENDSGVDSALVSLVEKISKRITIPVREFMQADRSGRTDKLGKVFLLVPAFASTLIIILILGFLWVESTPILTDPSGGPGIISCTPNTCKWI